MLTNELVIAQDKRFSLARIPQENVLLVAKDFMQMVIQQQRELGRLERA
jgi:hypothetical protein